MNHRYVDDVTRQIEQAVAEARADEAKRCCEDVCFWCKNPLVAEPAKRWPGVGRWTHVLKSSTKENPCDAAAIHERLSLKGGEGKER